MPAFEMKYSLNERTLTANLSAGTWVYFDVPSRLYEELISSDSQLDYFNKYIWNNFEFRRPYKNLSDFLDYVKENALTFSSCEPLNLHSLDWDGETLLHLACRWGDIDAVELLLREGVDPNTKGDEGLTALHAAEYWGHARCAKILLSAGAKPVEFLR